MKYAFMSFSCPALSLDEMLSLAKRLGYDGIAAPAGPRAVGAGRCVCMTGHPGVRHGLQTPPIRRSRKARPDLTHQEDDAPCF